MDILGDGRQSKSYIHVLDVVAAVLLAMDACEDNFQVFNVSTLDAITVQEIAEEAVACLALPSTPEYRYSGGDRGWKGDVPVVRLRSERIRALGWRSRWTSRDAMRAALDAMLAERRLHEEEAYA